MGQISVEIRRLPGSVPLGNQHLGLSREPAEFAANDTIRQIMQDSEGDDLPVFLVDGALKAKARYPARAELAEWAGVTTPRIEITEQVRELVALGAAIKAGDKAADIWPDKPANMAYTMKRWCWLEGRSLPA